MAFPAGLTLITVSGQVAGLPDGDPAGVSFRIPVWLQGPAAGAVMAPVRLPATLDADGEFSISLPATNDPAWTPVGWTYAVTITRGGHVQRGSLALPYDGGAVDLADAFNPDETTEPGVIYMLLSARGAAGGVAALDGTGKVPTAQLPAGAGGDPAWADITGKPSVFPHDSHRHAISDVTGLQAALDGRATDAELTALDGRVSDLEAVPTLVVKRATIDTGNLTLSAAGAWAAVTGGPSLALPAAAGDYVEFQIVSGLANINVNFVDLAVTVGGSLVRFHSTGGATAAPEGSPSFYGDGSFDRWGPTFEFVAEAGDISGGNVTVVFATKGAGGGLLYADTNYPLRWRAINHGPATVS